MTPKYVAQLYGGSSYSVSYPGEDMDTFNTKQAIIDEWDRRARSNYYPCWGDGIRDYCGPDDPACGAWVWYWRDDGQYPEYPDMVLEVGPRYGLRIVNA